MRMMKANSALDADESGTIEEAEIKNAAAALRKLDTNHDDKLTEEEAGMKYIVQNAAMTSVRVVDAD